MIIPDFLAIFNHSEDDTEFVYFPFQAMSPYYQDFRSNSYTLSNSAFDTAFFLGIL